jgi:hypothetical protein
MMLLRELSEELQKALQSGYLHLHRRVQELEAQLAAALTLLGSVPTQPVILAPRWISDRDELLAASTNTRLVARWRALEALSTLTRDKGLPHLERNDQFDQLPAWSVITQLVRAAVAAVEATQSGA